MKIRGTPRNGVSRVLVREDFTMIERASALPPAGLTSNTYICNGGFNLLYSNRPRETITFREVTYMCNCNWEAIYQLLCQLCGWGC